MKPRSVIGYALGFLGVTVVLATLALHGWLEYARPAESHEFLFVPLTTGAVIGWWGFFWADAKRAKEGGTFVISASERLHAHRRKDDPVPPIVGEGDEEGITLPQEHP